MTIRFAGSRSLDERRRRRLATEADDARESRTPLPQMTHEPGAERTDNSRRTQNATADLAAVRRLVPNRLWQLWVVAALGLLSICSLLIAGYYASTAPGYLGSELTTILAVRYVAHPTLHASPPDQTVSESTLPPTHAAPTHMAATHVPVTTLTALQGHALPSPACRFLAELLLVLSAQTSLLIWWVRSRSENDFDGRYSIWLWTAALWFVCALCVATGLHHVGSRLLLSVWPLDLWRKETLCWLIPFAAVGDGLLLGLRRDMRGCRLSLRLLTFSTLAFLSGALLVLLPDMAMHLVEQSLYTHGAFLLSELGLLVSLALHLRYVVHESAEPPPIPPHSLSVLFQRFRRFRDQRRQQRLAQKQAQTAARAEAKSAAIAATESAVASTAASSANTSVGDKTDSAESTAGQSAKKKTSATKPGTKKRAPRKKTASDKALGNSAASNESADKDASCTETPTQETSGKQSTAKATTARQTTRKPTTGKKTAKSASRKSVSGKSAASKIGTSEISAATTEADKTSQNQSAQAPAVSPAVPDTTQQAKVAASAIPQFAVDSDERSDIPESNTTTAKTSPKSSQRQQKQKVRIKADSGAIEEKTIHVDPAQPPDLKGLSKRERRLAQKRWREQQAKGHSSDH